MAGLYSIILNFFFFFLVLSYQKYHVDVLFSMAASLQHLMPFRAFYYHSPVSTFYQTPSPVCASVSNQKKLNVVCIALLLSDSYLLPELIIL